MMAKKQSAHDSVVEDLQVQLMQLQATQAEFAEQARRAKADYQNLQRRSQEDRVRMVKLAARGIIENLLEPLDNLYLAADQLKDAGLNMVVQQFAQVLNNEGLEEIEVLGQEFDPHHMEAIYKQVVDDPKQVNRVIKVMKRGYRLNGEVIRHAKVIMGVQA